VIVAVQYAVARCIRVYYLLLSCISLDFSCRLCFNLNASPFGGRTKIAAVGEISLWKDCVSHRVEIKGVRFLWSCASKNISGWNGYCRPLAFSLDCVVFAGWWWVVACTTSSPLSLRIISSWRGEIKVKLKIILLLKIQHKIRIKGYQSLKSAPCYTLWLLVQTGYWQNTINITNRWALSPWHLLTSASTSWTRISKALDLQFLQVERCRWAFCVLCLLVVSGWISRKLKSNPRRQAEPKRAMPNMFVDLVVPLIGELLRWISLLIFRILIFVFFNDVEVLGRENIPRTGAVIFVCKSTTCEFYLQCTNIH